MLVLAELSPIIINLALLAVILGSALLMLMVLIQKPQGGGLAGAFGSGAGSGQTAFGTKTGDALTIATIIVFSLWLLLSVGTNFVARPAKVVGTTSAEATPGTAPATAPATTPTTAPASGPAAPTTDAKPDAAPASTPAGGTEAPKPEATPAPATTPAPAPAQTPPATEPVPQTPPAAPK